MKSDVKKVELTVVYASDFGLKKALAEFYRKFSINNEYVGVFSAPEYQVAYKKGFSEEIESVSFLNPENEVRDLGNNVVGLLPREREIDGKMFVVYQSVMNFEK